VSEPQRLAELLAATVFGSSPTNMLACAGCECSGTYRSWGACRTYGPDHQIGIVVRDFTDDAMLKIMARENMEEWGSSASIEHETVRAVVEAYGAGQIQLPEPGPLTRNLRSAPSFTIGAAGAPRPPRPYTGSEIAAFLGWSIDKVQESLAALALVEQGHLTDADFGGLGAEAAKALVRETNTLLEQQRHAREAEANRIAEIEAARAAAAEREARAAAEREAAMERARQAQEERVREQARREAEEQQRAAQRAEQERRAAEAAQDAAKREQARREAERTKVRRDVTTSMRSNLRDPNVGITKARKEAQQTRERYAPDNAAPIDFGRFVRGLASRLARLLTQGDYADALAQIRRHRNHIPTADGDQLVTALQEMRQIIDRHLELLGASPDTPDVITSDVIDAELID
jgi:chemotaxis protein histidine kinase CheA